jgi:hypothetical protein
VRPLFTAGRFAFFRRTVCETGHVALNVVDIQSWDRVKGTKCTRIMERIRVSLGAIFSITVSCRGASAGPRGMTSRLPTLSCSISSDGTCPSAAVSLQMPGRVVFHHCKTSSRAWAISHPMISALCLVEPPRPERPSCPESISVLSNKSRVSVLLVRSRATHLAGSA